VCHKPNKIGQFTDIQLTVVISIGHFEFLLNEAKDLALGYLATVGALIGLFRHGECLAFNTRTMAITLGSQWGHCPSRHIKMMSIFCRSQAH
jgi:hypothetical protein